MQIDYWIAKYIKNVIRNEPKNIGVFVKFDGQVVSKFFGENSEKLIEKNFRYPDVYRQWLVYWKSKNVNPEEFIKSDGHYRVEKGGFVSDIDGEEIGDILDYIYQITVE